MREPARERMVKRVWCVAGEDLRPGPVYVGADGFLYNGRTELTEPADPAGVDRMPSGYVQYGPGPDMKIFDEPTVHSVPEFDVGSEGFPDELAGELARRCARLPLREGEKAVFDPLPNAGPFFFANNRTSYRDIRPTPDRVSATVLAPLVGQWGIIRRVLDTSAQEARGGWVHGISYIVTFRDGTTICGVKNADFRIDLTAAPGAPGRADPRTGKAPSRKPAAAPERPYVV